jgi:hypothetical protein
MSERPAEPRILRWLGELERAGDDGDKARAVLHEIRDSKASKLELDHFYRALAQQSAIWLEEAARGKPLSEAERQDMVREAQTRFEQRVERAKKLAAEQVAEAQGEVAAPPAKK